MRQVWVRFYKSFNYDYDLKADRKSTTREWEMTEDGWRPFVGVPLESDITAVVGANESGKTHLLDAINIVLTGKGLVERDFCRYSTLFSVEKGKRRFPEVGATFALSDEDKVVLRELKVPLLGNGDLQVFRRRPDLIEVLSDDGAHFTLDEAQSAVLAARLPHAHKLDTQVDLPDAVSIAALAGQDALTASRAKRLELLRFLASIGTKEALSEKVGTLFSLMSMAEEVEQALDLAQEKRKQKLGRDLLLDIAKIDPESFRELQKAITEHREGLVNGLIQEMNKSIARHLNVSRWWSQDEDFQLRVSPREHELVFTIRDRTGTDYSFSERSRGLTYFLSYYVQLRSHLRPPNRPEVLLMDEPDAYLSALGQQDLLRVLEDHARPEDGSRADQVVYVTHSPFLINRNAGHRVRVLDKGIREQGTRLVKNITQTHYEPLRTSLGPSVAETAFIGGENLFVEGISDQVLLTAMNARLIRAGLPPSQRLDLNQVTIVPGGSNVAYMLYLARGRDPHKPACAVLLDSDSAGREAHRAIKRGGAKGRPTVPDELIVMLGDWASEAGVQHAPGVSVEEPEDLVPLKLAGIAARSYARAFLGHDEAEAAKLTDDAISAELTADKHSMWNAVETAFVTAFGTKPGKLGFAKELIAYLEEHEREEQQPDGVDTLVGNYTKLLDTLSRVLREARAREDDHQLQERVQRIIDDFVQAHPTAASRDGANMMLEQIDSATDSSAIGDAYSAGVIGLRRDHELTVNPLSPVDDFDEFIARLTALPRTAQMIGQGHSDAVQAAAAEAGLPVHGTPPPQQPGDEPQLKTTSGSGAENAIDAVVITPEEVTDDGDNPDTGHDASAAQPAPEAAAAASEPVAAPAQPEPALTPPPAGPQA